MRHCTIHIGMSKTGTSSVQVFLNKNKYKLSSLGVGVVYSPRVIPACVLEPDVNVPLFKSLRLSSMDAIEAYQKNKKRKIKDALVKNEKAIISSEWFCGFNEKQIERLYEYLSSFFDSFKVVVYFRRQDRYAVSLYGLRLILGEMVDSPLDLTSAYRRRLDYLTVIESWASVFGKEAILPRVFQKEELLGDDLYTDFLDSCGLAIDDSFEVPENNNESLDKSSQEFLLRLNKKEKRFVSGVPNKNREKVIRFLKSQCKGKGKLPLRCEAIEFMERYNNMNSIICEKYFPGRKSLFDNNFDDYPVSSGEIKVTEREVDFVEKLVALNVPFYSI